MLREEKIELLRQNELFQTLTVHKLNQIMDRYDFPVVTYEPGKWIAFRGEPYTKLVVILSGQVRAEMTDHNGNVMVIETMTAPQIMASAVFFAKMNQLPVSVVAVTKLTVLYIEKPQLVRIFQESAEFLEAFLADNGSRLMFLTQKLRLMSFASIRQKMAVYLIDQCKPDMISVQKCELKIHHTKQQLSDIFSVARPSLSRVCSEMEKEGLIEVRGKDIYIPNISRLQKIAKNYNGGSIED